MNQSAVQVAVVASEYAPAESSSLALLWMISVVMAPVSLFTPVLGAPSTAWVEELLDTKLARLTD
jgi:hypothetical protein